MARLFTRRTFVFCTTALVSGAVHARLSWSRVLSESQSPVFPNDTAQAPSPLHVCMRFLDTHQVEWRVESSDLPTTEVCAGSKPKLQMLRLKTLFPSDSPEEPSVPFLRLIGFIPNVLPDEVFSHMTDVELRQRWDRNYTMFSRWDGGGNDKVIDELSQIERPIGAVAEKVRICDGDSCSFLPDITSRVVDWGWFAHGVGSSLMDRFGIAERMFVYERGSFCYEKRGCDAGAPRMYDVLYKGTTDEVERNSTLSESFAQWLRQCESGRKTARVSINYQHVLIIPIADAVTQLWRTPNLLLYGGSVVDEPSTRAIYETYAESVRLHASSNKLDGTLIIMTSANDVQMPKHIPMWAQRMLSTAFSRHAYRQLSDAILGCRGKKGLKSVTTQKGIN
ncbi:hypothetical protein ERJ75_000716100 [Trypanosoma vivax]|nr:hypothetical protein ERJ75_000716100 [Trypanosoma vivax]